MSPKLLLSAIVSGVILTCNISASTSSYEGKMSHSAKQSSNKKTIALEGIVRVAPWSYDYDEPFPLPKFWQKHIAKHNITVPYAGAIVYIPKGDTYFTYKGKVAIGFHGTYNPPCGM